MASQATLMTGIACSDDETWYNALVSYEEKFLLMGRGQDGKAMDFDSMYRTFESCRPSLHR